MRYLALVLLVMSIVCLALSMLASLRSPHHETDRDVAARIGGSIASALWAIMFLLLAIVLR